MCVQASAWPKSVLDDHIKHHQHVQALYERLLADIPGVNVHTSPANPPSFQGSDGDRYYDSNFWLCAATLDPEVRIQGQENAYQGSH